VIRQLLADPKKAWGSSNSCSRLLIQEAAPTQALSSRNNWGQTSCKSSWSMLKPTSGASQPFSKGNLFPSQCWQHMEGKCRQEAETAFALSPHLFKRLQGGHLSPPCGILAWQGCASSLPKGCKRLPRSPRHAGLLRCPDNPKRQMEGTQLRV